MASVHLAMSSSGGRSSKYRSECIDRVFRRTKFAEVRPPAYVGDSRSLSVSASSKVLVGDVKSREVRPVDSFGT